MNDTTCRPPHTLIIKDPTLTQSTMMTNGRSRLHRDRGKLGWQVVTKGPPQLKAPKGTPTWGYEVKSIGQ